MTGVSIGGTEQHHDLETVGLGEHRREKETDCEHAQNMKTWCEQEWVKISRKQTLPSKARMIQPKEHLGMTQVDPPREGQTAPSSLLSLTAQPFSPPQMTPGMPHN